MAYLALRPAAAWSCAPVLTQGFISCAEQGIVEGGEEEEEGGTHSGPLRRYGVMRAMLERWVQETILAETTNDVGIELDF